MEPGDRIGSDGVGTGCKHCLSMIFSMIFVPKIGSPFQHRALWLEAQCLAGQRAIGEGLLATAGLQHHRVAHLGEHESDVEAGLIDMPQQRSGIRAVLAVAIVGDGAVPRRVGHEHAARWLDARQAPLHRSGRRSPRHAIEEWIVAAGVEDDELEPARAIRRVEHRVERYGFQPHMSIVLELGIDRYQHVTGQNIFENEDAIMADFAAAIRTRTTQEWLDILLAEDVWCAPVYDFSDMEKDPQVAENEMIVTYKHPIAGTVRALGMPVKFQGTPGAITRPAPQLGQHSVEILRDLCEYDPSEIQNLLEQKVVINSHG